MKKPIKNKFGKRFITLFLSLVLIAGALPAAAMAQEQTEPAQTQSIAPEALPGQSFSGAQTPAEDSAENRLADGETLRIQETSSAQEAGSVPAQPVASVNNVPDEPLSSPPASSEMAESALPAEIPAATSGIGQAGIASGKQAVRLMGRMEAEYTLSFDVNGGIPATQPASQVMGEWYLATNPQDPEHATKTFINWNTSPDGSGMEWEFSTQTMPAEDVTLYAQWQPAPDENNILPSVPGPAPLEPEVINPAPLPDSSTPEAGTGVPAKPEASSSKPGPVSSSKPAASSSASSKPNIASSSSTSDASSDGAAVTPPPPVISSSSVSSAPRRVVSSSQSTSASESEDDSALPGAVGNYQDTQTPGTPGGDTQEGVLPAETAAIADTDSTNLPSLLSIANGLIPFSSGGQWPAWALLNLILAIASVAMAVVLGIRYATHRQEQAGAHATQTPPTRFAKIKQYGAFRMASVGVALIASALFLLTENLRNTMVLVDSRTIAMLLLAAVQVALMLFSKSYTSSKKPRNAQDAKNKKSIYRRKSAQL